MSGARALPPASYLAGLIAILGWWALGVELTISLHGSFAEGRGVVEALYLYLRFFTILTNLFVASLMTATVWRLVARGPLPNARCYAAAVVYILVVGVTYEMLLRRLWSPHGVQFVTDMTMHDVVPALLLVFWIGFAAKTPLRWRDAVRWLEFPTVYFVVTLIAAALGQGSPYGFLDADALGYAGVVRNGLAFLAAFYGLGLLAVAVARVLPLDPVATSPSAGD